MEVPVYTFVGEKSGRTCSLPLSSLDEVAHADHLAYLSVKAYLAAQRQGTHQSKERSFVHGSTRKLRKQKGTGNARVGSRKSPIFRGGGRAFGPSPRDYTMKVNKKTRRLARGVALSSKLQDKQLLVVENFSFEEPKTKRYLEFLSNFSFQGKKSLLVISEADKVLYLSSRNLPFSSVRVVDFLNTYEVLDNEQIVFFEKAAAKLEKMLP